MNEEFFLAQYNQVWNQRRQHVALIWAIPAAFAAFLALVVNGHIPFNQLHTCTKLVTFITFIFFSWGIVRLFLRHNYFQRCYGLLLQHMDVLKKPLEPLPQSGDDLKEWLEKEKIFDSKLDFFEKLGSKRKGMISWMIIVASATLFSLSILMDLYLRDIVIIFFKCCSIC